MAGGHLRVSPGHAPSADRELPDQPRSRALCKNASLRSCVLQSGGSGAPWQASGTVHAPLRRMLDLILVGATGAFFFLSWAYVRIAEKL